MRLIAEVAVGVAAGVLAYALARPGMGVPESIPAATQRTADRRHEPPLPDRADRLAPAQRAAHPAAMANSEPSEAAHTPAQESAMTMLRNAAIGATARDMHERGQDVSTCFDGVSFSGVQKLRFAVEVVSTPAAATLGRWRFIEVADGEPVPASFEACAARVLGGGQQLMPPAGFRFPDYRGDISFVYTIPAPPG